MNKKGLLIVIAVIIIAIVTVVTIVALNKNEKDNPEVIQNKMIGIYELTNVVSADGISSADDIALLKQYNLVVYLELKDDGVGTLNNYGEVMDITYTDSVINMYGNDYKYSQNDDIITINVDENTYEYKKIDPSEVINQGIEMQVEEQ